jgi:hypothetical protein
MDSINGVRLDQDTFTGRPLRSMEHHAGFPLNHFPRHTAGTKRARLDWHLPLSPTFCAVELMLDVKAAAALAGAATRARVRAMKWPTFSSSVVPNSLISRSAQAQKWPMLSSRARLPAMPKIRSDELEVRRVTILPREPSWRREFVQWIPV